MEQVTIPINNLPVNLVLLSNKCVALVRTCHFPSIFDQPSKEGNISAEFHNEHFVVDSKKFMYNTMLEIDYEPSLKSWLISQNLVKPYHRRG